MVKIFPTPLLFLLQKQPFCHNTAVDVKEIAQFDTPKDHKQKGPTLEIIGTQPILLNHGFDINPKFIRKFILLTFRIDKPRCPVSILPKML